jgi:hypothetical protein
MDDLEFEEGPGRQRQVERQALPALDLTLLGDARLERKALGSGRIGRPGHTQPQHRQRRQKEGD